MVLRSARFSRARPPLLKNIISKSVVAKKKNEEIIEKRYLYDLARIVLYFAHAYHQTSVQSFFFKSTMKKSGA